MTGHNAACSAAAEEDSRDRMRHSVEMSWCTASSRTPCRWSSSKRVAASAPTTSSRCCSKNRIVFLGTPIDDTVSNLIVAQLLYLAQEDPERDIQMYVNSPGGQVDAGLAIYDTMHLIQPDVATTCVGMAASMGAVLLGGGAKGKRAALPNARILIHQASAGVQGTAADIEVHAREILRLNARLKELMAADTGQEIDRISRDINRDYWMSAREARDYGVIDMIHGQTEATQAADRAEAAVNEAAANPRRTTSRMASASCLQPIQTPHNRIHTQTRTAAEARRGTTPTWRQHAAPAVSTTVHFAARARTRSGV